MLEIPFTDSELEEMPYYKPSSDSEEIKYLRDRRKALGGYLPTRKSTYSGFHMPKDSAFTEFDKGTPKRAGGFDHDGICKTT